MEHISGTSVGIPLGWAGMGNSFANGDLAIKTGDFTGMGLTKISDFELQQSLDAKVSHVASGQSTWICPSWQSEMIFQARREAQAQRSTYNRSTWILYSMAGGVLLKSQLQNICLALDFVNTWNKASLGWLLELMDKIKHNQAWNRYIDDTVCASTYLAECCYYTRSCI